MRSNAHSSTKTPCTCSYLRQNPHLWSLRAQFAFGSVRFGLARFIFYGWFMHVFSLAAFFALWIWSEIYFESAQLRNNFPFYLHHWSKTWLTSHRQKLAYRSHDLANPWLWIAAILNMLNLNLNKHIPRHHLKGMFTIIWILKFATLINLFNVT